MFSHLTLSEGGLVALGIVCAAAAVAALVWFVRRRRNSPAERERRRRLKVQRSGRIIDGAVTDFRFREATLGQSAERLIEYHYFISGVKYSTVQDVSTLMDAVGEDPAGVIGGATVKYLTNNPYNSIVVCEQWSGLRGVKTVPAKDSP